MNYTICIIKTNFKRLKCQFSKFQNTATMLLSLFVLTSKYQIMAIREVQFH